MGTIIGTVKITLTNWSTVLSNVLLLCTKAFNPRLKSKKLHWSIAKELSRSNSENSEEGRENWSTTDTTSISNFSDPTKGVKNIWISDGVFGSHLTDFEMDSALHVTVAEIIKLIWYMVDCDMHYRLLTEKFSRCFNRTQVVNIPMHWNGFKS